MRNQKRPFDFLLSLEDALECHKKREYRLALSKYTHTITQMTESGELFDQESLYLVFYNRGVCYNDLERYEEAIIDFTRVLDLLPNDTDATKEMMYALHQLGRI